MKAKILYWLIIVSGMLISVLSGILIHNQWIPPILIAATLTLSISLVLTHSREDEIHFKFWNSIKVQVKKLFWYNLFTFPVLMCFYIPYQLFWIGLTPLQLIKYVATAGFFGAMVNIFVRPVVAYVTRFNDKRYGKKSVNITSNRGFKVTGYSKDSEGHIINHIELVDEKDLNIDNVPSVSEEKETQ